MSKKLYLQDIRCQTCMAAVEAKCKGCNKIHLFCCAWEFPVEVFNDFNCGVWTKRHVSQPEITIKVEPTKWDLKWSEIKPRIDIMQGRE